MAGVSRVTAIARLGEAMLPDPSVVGQEGDIVWVTVAGDKMDVFEEHLTGVPVTGGQH
jgi:Trk K+ transport system NAD-binding subunit